MLGLPLPGLWQAREELEEVRGGHLLRPAQPQIRHRCFAGGAQEPVPRLPLQEQLHPHAEEAKGFLLVQRTTRSPFLGCSGA